MRKSDPSDRFPYERTDANEYDISSMKEYYDPFNKAYINTTFVDTYNPDNTK